MRVAGLIHDGIHDGAYPGDDGPSQTTEGAPCVSGVTSSSPLGVVGASVYVIGVFSEDFDSELHEISDMGRRESS